MRYDFLGAALLTLAVIAITQAASYAIWGNMEGGYELSIILAGIMIPAATCFPISFYLLRQRRRLAATLAQLQQAHLHLMEFSSRDPMTGLLHRQAFFARLESRDCRSGVFLMIDVDHFKSVNDTNGHSAGDDAIRLIANELADIADEGCIVARFGGEEFCLFGPVDDVVEGRKLGEVVRRRIGRLSFAPGGRQRRLTVSVGVAAAASHGDAQSAISAADAALYEAKRQGRNRVVVAESPDETGPARVVA